MSISVRNLQRIAKVNCSLLRQQLECIRDSIENGAYKAYEASMLVTTNSRMRKINHRHAGRKETTDVLSFPMRDIALHGNEKFDYEATLEKLRSSPYLNPLTGKIESADAAPKITPDLGTIFIAGPFCESLARKRGMDVSDYILLCCVHGMAHLAGYDHQTYSQLEEMRAVEETAIRSLVKEELCSSQIPRSYIYIS